jgi:hypothetical protein
MQEYRLVLSQATESNPHYISRASQMRLRMSDNAATLEPFRLQPSVQEIEDLAAVVDLAIGQRER